MKLKLDKGGAAGAVFLDLKKAFDTVNHNVLLTEFSCCNLSGAITWMQSYLTMRKQYTIILH